MTMVQLILKLLYKIISKGSMNIYGPFKRNCTKDGYSFNTQNGFNTILTPILMTSKKLVSLYIKDGINDYMDWVVKHKGNCEDLGINAFLKSNNIKPIYVTGEYTNLDTSDGFSSKSNHHKIRGNFCKKYMIT